MLHSLSNGDGNQKYWCFGTFLEIAAIISYKSVPNVHILCISMQDSMENIPLMLLNVLKPEHVGDNVIRSCA